MRTEALRVCGQRGSAMTKPLEGFINRMRESRVCAERAAMTKARFKKPNRMSKDVYAGTGRLWDDKPASRGITACVKSHECAHYTKHSMLRARVMLMCGIVWPSQCQICTPSLITQNQSPCELLLL